MKKRITKTIAIMLALVMTSACALMTGCGAESDDTLTLPQISEPAKDDTATPDAQTESSETEETSETDEPDVSETDTENEDLEADMSETQLSDGITIPELSMPKLNVPDNETFAFIDKLGVGFNLGNTFDAYSDPTPADEMSTETCWHHTYTTEQMIKDIHAYGFDTIRIPVSWHNHVDDDVNISPEWLDRVNEVVDWAIDDGMYVIINIHHDNHAEANGLYPDNAHMDRSRKYVGRIWEQLSERFKDYDEHLIFEAMNEPRLVDTEHEWNFIPGNKECHEAIDCINELNQIFVDTVRASGGNNATRYLMCPGYAASMDGGTNPFYEFPTDTESNEGKIILSIHAYTPYSFALEYPGVSDFSVEDKSKTNEINTFMNKLYMDYVSQGVPVIIGEFGARDKNGNLQDRVNYAAYFSAMANARHIPCVWWDNNEFTGSGELFGIYDRNNPENSRTDIIYALMEYK